MTEREYQLAAKEALDRLYGEVVVQWYPFRGHGRQIYGPVVDIAVGPFATEGRFENEYHDLLHDTRPFIESLIEKHNQNVEEREERTTFERILYFNENARCLLCVEVEDSGSKKHCLGDLVNASALGRIGLLIARSEETFRAFLRQRIYLHYLTDVGKNSFRTDNVLVLTGDQFDECLALIRTPRHPKIPG